MATDLTAWSVEILPHISNVPDSGLKVAVRNAAIEFCEKTHLWTQDLTRITVVAKQQDYTLTDPTDSEIIGVDNVRYKQDGLDDDQFKTLDPLSENQMDLHDTGTWMYREASTPSKFWADVVNKQLHLYQIPTEDSTEGLLVKVILRPSDNCTSLSDFLYEEHKKSITYGTLAELFSQKAMAWYDGQNALICMGLFETACDGAKIKRITGATKRPLRARMQFFA